MIRLLILCASTVCLICLKGFYACLKFFSSEVRPNLRESSSRHSSKKTERPPGVASDQSVDRVKLQESGSLPSTIKSEMPSGVASGPVVDRVELQESGSLPSITKKERPSCVASDPSINGRKLQESGSLDPLEKTEMPSDMTSDQSIDGIEQQFNLSFNKTNQINIDASDVEIHIAELHAVSGFTHLFDGNHKGKNDKPPLLKREVSRTWSFAAEVEPVKAKGGSSFEKSRELDKSDNANGVGLKSPLSDAPKPSSYPININDNKETRQYRASHFASKGDASQKTAGESFEDIDENSVDAVPAAALKKAIEQAQESIRIAKIIMERKKDGYQDGSKLRPISCSKVADRETKIDHKVFGSKNNSTRKKLEELDSICPAPAGIDGNLTPSVSHSGKCFHTDSSVAERVLENVETYKEPGETFAGRSKLFSSNHIQTETTHVDEHDKVEKHEKNVEADEMQREGQKFHGVVDFDHGKAGNLNSFVLPTGEPSSDLGRLETDTETFKWRDVFANLMKRSEVVPTLEKESLNTSHSSQGMKKSRKEDELYQANFVYAEGPENNGGRVLSSSQRTFKRDKAVDEANENLRICQEDDVKEGAENDRDDKKVEECDEMANARSQSNHMLNESCNLVSKESLDQQEMERKTESIAEWERNGEGHAKTYDEEIGGTRQKEGNLWFDNEEQPKEVLLEVINEEKPDVFPEIGELKVEVDEVHEPEVNDNKHTFGDNVDGPELPGELVWNQVEEEHVNTSKYEGAIMMEACHCNKFQKMESSSEAEQTDTIKRGAGTGESEETAYDEDIDEAVNLSGREASIIFDNAHTNGTSDLIAETQESCHVESNSKEEECQKSAKNVEEDVPKSNGAVSALDEDRMEEGLFSMLDDEMPRTNKLRRSSSEEILVENKLHDACEGLPSDSRKEPVDVMDADPQENLSQEEELSKTISDIHAAAQEYCAAQEYIDGLHRHDVPQVLESHFRKVELDFPDIEQMLGQTAESDEGSISDSSIEKINELSAQKSKECAENVNGTTSNKENLSDDTISDETKYAEKLREGLYSQLHGEPKIMDKASESEGAVDTDANVEKDEENIVGTPSLEERDAKEGIQNFESNDQQQRIEAIKKGREREKDKIAVERAIREARERAFAEVRERAERAAVERAASEVRQRVAEAREKVEKPAVVKQPLDKASIEAKLRAERAAVERATAEARERALQKAKSLKTSGELNASAEKHSTERFSSSSRNNVLKHSFSSSVSITCLFICLPEGNVCLCSLNWYQIPLQDLETGTNIESAQRRKARLERHQRIMERAVCPSPYYLCS